MLFEGKIPSKARSLGDSCAARDGRRVEECLVRARREVGAAAARADAGGREGGPSRRLQRLRRLRGGGWHPSARPWASVDSHAHRLETGSQGGCVLQRQRCSQNAESSENHRAPHDKMFRSFNGQNEAAFIARLRDDHLAHVHILTMKSMPRGLSESRIVVMRPRESLNSKPMRLYVWLKTRTQDARPQGY